jgi:hypothetical protein
MNNFQDFMFRVKQIYRMPFRTPYDGFVALIFSLNIYYLFNSIRTGNMLWIAISGAFIFFSLGYGRR